MDNLEKRIIDLEKRADWTGDRLWHGTGNIHDRTHKLEDRQVTVEHEMTIIKEDVSRIEQILGMNNYGGKSIISDLKDALDTIQNLKGNVITTRDFQTLMNDVQQLKQRGQVQLNFWNFVQFSVIAALIGVIVDFVKAAVTGAP